MSLKERIASDLESALRSGEKERTSALRMLRARFLEREVELRSSKGRDYQLDDEEAIDVISTYAKQRRQSIESYQQAARQDPVEKEKRELQIVQGYLPGQLSENELEEIVAEKIRETAAEGPRDMGKVMKEVMAKVKGAAEGKTVSQIVQRQLAEKK